MLQMLMNMGMRFLAMWWLDAQPPLASGAFAVGIYGLDAFGSGALPPVARDAAQLATPWACSTFLGTGQFPVWSTVGSGIQVGLRRLFSFDPDNPNRGSILA